MILDIALVYLGSLKPRLEALDEAILEQRRQAIRGTIFLLIRDAFDREDAIQHAHDAGLMNTPLETFEEDLLAVVQQWLPIKEVTDVN